MKIPSRGTRPPTPVNRWSIANGLLRAGLCFILAGVSVWRAATSSPHPGQRLLVAGFWLVLGTGMLSWERHQYRAWLHADRIRRGLCPRCGYDLRESAARCPECGRRVPDAILLARKITLKPPK